MRVAENRGLQRWIVGVLMVIELLLCVLLSEDLTWFVGPIRHPREQWLTMHVYVLVGGFSLGLKIFCGLLWCGWAVGVAEHLRALGQCMRYMPQNLLLWFVIPGLNLVRPYATMLELWKASVAAARGTPDWTAIPTRPWLVAWWTLWVIHLLAFPLTVVAMVVAEDRRVADGLFLLGMTIRHATLLAATPLAIVLLRQIGRNLARAAERAQMEASS